MVSTNDGSNKSDEGERPPLPPRPRNLGLFGEDQRVSNKTLQIPISSKGPQVQSNATTAISLTDIQTQSYGDGLRETYASSTRLTPSRKSFGFKSPKGKRRSCAGSEADDSASVKSYGPTLEGVDVESLLGDVLGSNQVSPAWQLLSNQVEKLNPFDLMPYDEEEPTADFSRDFDELGALAPNGENEGM